MKTPDSVLIHGCAPHLGVCSEQSVAIANCTMINAIISIVNVIYQIVLIPLAALGQFWGLWIEPLMCIAVAQWLLIWIQFMNSVKDGAGANVGLTQWKQWFTN